ncbi:MAG: hypothetical protein SGILL_001830 [Bacillariaceae sp.]
MKTRPKLVRILNPPSLGNSNTILYSTNFSETARKANAAALTKTYPSAGAASASASGNSNFKLLHVTLHPAEPLVAYLLENSGDFSHNVTSSSVGNHENVTETLQKWIVVQHSQTQQVVWSMSVGEIAAALLSSNGKVDSTTTTASTADLLLSKTGEARIYKFVKEQLGKLQHLSFIDPSSLYWSGFANAPNDSGTEEDNSNTPAKPLRWSHLMVQFQSRILILNLRQNAASIFAHSILRNNNDAIFAPILANISADSLSSSSPTPAISSNALCVGETMVAVACADGTVKLYDWSANKVMQSVHALTAWTVGGSNMAKSDCIVEIVAANPYGFHPAEQYEHSKKRPRCIVCLTRKGAAYLCPLKTAKNGALNIESPIARMEGGSVPASISKQDDEHSSSMEHVYCSYDAFRDLLLWNAPSKNKSKLFVWDLSVFFEAKKTLDNGDKTEPTLVLQFPYENMSHMVFPGWYHEATPKESMTCVVVTKEGDFQVLVAPLHNSGSSTKYPFVAVPILGVNLMRLAKRDLDLPEERPLAFKTQSVLGQQLRDSSSFVVTTSIGLLIIKMMDGTLVPFPGTRHAHFSANFGTLGRAVLYVKGPQVLYSPLEPEGGLLEVNPIGRMEYGPSKGTVVYESPPPMHLPPEIQKRPVRLPPCFLQSPSKNFVCCFWKEEMRYEVLSISTVMERVTNRNPNMMAATSPVVASGNGITSFAWVGDDDLYSLLYDPEQDLALKVGIDLSTGDVGKDFDISKMKEIKKLKELARLKTYKKGVKSVVGTAGKLKSLDGIKDLGKDTGKFGLGAMKGVKKLSLGTVKLGGKVAAGASQATTAAGAGASKQMTKMSVGKKLKFGFGKKKGHAKKGVEGSLANSELDEKEEDEAPVRGAAPLVSFDEAEPDMPDKGAEMMEKKYPWVELRMLVPSDSGVAGVTASNLGQMTLRSGNRNPPTVLFGGPVLCVGSKLDESDEGLAYFYTKKKDQEEESADVYISSGPAFPCPSFVAWDDDGLLCAVVVQDRVSVYLSDEPNFVMLGTVHIGSAGTVSCEIISCRFIHNVLYCTTRNSVQCVFLGDLNGGVCYLDSYVLASSAVTIMPSKTIASDYKSLCPPAIPMPLVHPEVLGYQNGSLILSTVSGVIALPLGFPLLRIGSLIAAGPDHILKAEKWFGAVPNSDHEVLATFLERRGVPELALSLPGVSMERIVDMCMRHGYVDRLEEVVEMYGLAGMRSIDMSRGVSSNIFGPEEHGASVVVCVGAYLLGHGRVELVRRLATECLSSGEDGRQEAFLLSGLLMSVNGSDAKRVMQRAVEDANEEDDWLVGSFVKTHIL